MISEKDIADVVYEVLSGDAGTPRRKSTAYKSGFYTQEKWINSYSSLKSKKKLVTEFDVRAAIQNGAAAMRLPADAIIGPLALELIQEKNIKIIRG